MSTVSEVGAASEKDSNRWASLFRSVEFFEPFGGDGLNEMLNSSMVKRYKANEVIIEKNSEGGSFFIIVSGKANVYLESVETGNYSTLQLSEG